MQKWKPAAAVSLLLIVGATCCAAQNVPAVPDTVCITGQEREDLTEYVEDLEFFRDVSAPAWVKAVKDSNAVNLRAVTFERDFYKDNQPHWYDDKTLWFAFGAVLAVLATNAGG